MIVASTAIAAFSGRMPELTEAAFELASNAVTLAIGLIGALALWLGIIRVVEAAEMMGAIAMPSHVLATRKFD